MEEAMALSFEFVNNCKPGDLLRVKIEDTAEFAILGANEGHGLPALVALKDNEPPFAINLHQAEGAICLRGNHEELMLRATESEGDLTNFFADGDDATITSLRAHRCVSANARMGARALSQP